MSDPLLRATLTQLSQLLDSGLVPTAHEAVETLGLLRAIEITIVARAMHGGNPPAPSTVETVCPDSWLTAAEVASRLKRTRTWVYRQARTWSFAKRPSRKTLLISERGLTRWMEHR